MPKVTCPCCKGEGEVITMDTSHNFIITDITPCTHCEGTGKVEAEVEDPDDNRTS
jgi:DnaJ-class molecular chaperone